MHLELLDLRLVDTDPGSFRIQFCSVTIVIVVVIILTVDRDDIPDGGAQHFAHTVELLKHKKPELLVECLVSDFQGNSDSVQTLAISGLDVYAHNIETVERLQKVRKV